MRFLRMVVPRRILATKFRDSREMSCALSISWSGGKSSREQEKRVSFEVIALSRIRRWLSARRGSLTFTSAARKEKRDRPGRGALYKLGISRMLFASFQRVTVRRCVEPFSRSTNFQSVSRRERLLPAFPRIFSRRIARLHAALL